MKAQFEPIIGRYLNFELLGRPHRLYVEEAGQGAPLLSRTTTGLSLLICPGMGSRRRPRVGTKKSTN